MSGLKDQSAFETFNRMEAKIDQIEAEAEAQSELADEYTGDVLAHKFAGLERDAGADDDLAALKQKMGLAPPPPPPAATPEPVQARVEASGSVPAPTHSQAEQDELAAALEEMEAEHQAQQRKAGR